MDRKAHWEQVYRTNQPADVSWYQSWPTRSLELITQAGVGPESAVIDLGGGDSTLVDALLEQNAGHVTVLDISGAALDRAKARLGVRAEDVTWLEADVTAVELPLAAFDVWHDRAVFHFLTDLGDRRRYVAAARRALRPGGALIVGTFAADGPTRCSGLDVARYSPAALAREFGADFELRASVTDVHRTPAGVEQQYLYAVFRKR
jgi:ubiquinone/menaquinone biosynthesis C-methylase UbiE